MPSFPFTSFAAEDAGSVVLSLGDTEHRGRLLKFTRGHKKMRRLSVEQDNRIKPFEGAQVFHYFFGRFTGLAFVAANSLGFFSAFVYVRLGLIALSAGGDASRWKSRSAGQIPGRITFS